MAREILYVKCIDYYDYIDLMAYLDTIDFNWACGDKPLKWDFYSHCKINRQLTVVIFINLKTKEISYVPNHSVPQDEYTFKVEDVKKDLEHFLKSRNFDELKCQVTIDCKECPLMKYENVCNAMAYEERFVDALKRINEEYMKAKEAYEKGDK